MNRTHDGAALRVQTQAAAIFELLKSGTATAGADDAFRKLTETAARTLGVRRVSIWLFDAARANLEAADLFWSRAIVAPFIAPPMDAAEAGRWMEASPLVH